MTRNTDITGDEFYAQQDPNQTKREKIVYLKNKIRRLLQELSELVNINSPLSRAEQARIIKRCTTIVELIKESRSIEAKFTY